jgi:hypothetical protein
MSPTRLTQPPPFHLTQSLRRELGACWSLRHENIVPFLGIAIIEGVFPSIVTIWMANGEYFPMILVRI